MKKIICVSYIFLIYFALNAQFYNGHQMDFGKNRIQYKPFEWRYYRTTNYDIYVYERGENIGKYVKEIIDKEYAQLNEILPVNIRTRIYFIVYNKLSEFKQSNIGIKNDNLESNIGGQYQIFRNKVFIFFQKDHLMLRRQVRQVLAQLFVNEALYGSLFFDRMSSSAVNNIPTWFEKGLVSYLSQPYDIDAFNRLNILLQNKKNINFNHLVPNEQVFVGHCFWYYIYENYGNSAISSIIYFTKSSKSIKLSIEYVLGIKMKKLIKNFQQYWKENFYLSNAQIPQKELNSKLTKKLRNYYSPVLSPNGKMLAYVENFEGRYKVIVYDLATQKKKIIYKSGQRLEQIRDITYPVLTWNSTSNLLAFTTEKESFVTIWLYNFTKDELKWFVLPGIEKVIDMSFAPSTPLITFSGLSNGFIDIFVLNPLSAAVERITQDLPDDISPVFSKDGSKIIFASNRVVDSIAKIRLYENNLEIGNQYDLFVYDYKTKSNKLLRITNTWVSNEFYPIEKTKNTYFYLSDSSGILNLFEVKVDSTIGFVDTAIHYFYFTKTLPKTNYNNSLLQYSYLSPSQAVGVFVGNKKEIIAPLNFTETSDVELNKIRKNFISAQLKIYQENFRKQKEKDLIERKIDSLKPYYEKFISTSYNPPIEIQNYSFEIEKDSLFFRYYVPKYLPFMNKKDKAERPFENLLVYHPVFFISDLLSQFDFSMLNQSYQPFTGGPFYFNPGISYFNVLGANELFENYKIYGGFRFSLNGSNEYIFSYENLKKRIDKQVIFYRQSLINVQQQSIYYYDVHKAISNVLMFLWRYPFDEVKSLRASLIGKYDIIHKLSVDYTSLVKKPTRNYFLGGKIEYICDNTRELSLNLLSGIRMKIFGEYYYKINKPNYNTYVIGGDIRLYKEIYRSIVFATRFAGATSFGNGKVIFYLGGVDNWYNLSLDTAQSGYFDKSVRINPEINYIFQAVATNLRGFAQNIRNGNSFILSNIELRVPIIRTLMPWPVNSDFLYNFQIVGFFDIGSAWAGLSPYDSKNLYHTIVKQRYPFTMIVDLERPPFVFGYGWGVRTKLLGYFVRFDFSWGYEGYYRYPMKFYFSLSKDF